MFLTLVAVCVSACDTTLSNRVFTSRASISATTFNCVEIFDSLFDSITSSDDGGALEVETYTTTLAIGQTTFLRCKSSRQGGAMNFKTRETRITNVCAIECSALNGAFASCYTYDERLTIDTVTYARCEGNIGGIRVLQGVLSATRINASYNTLKSGGSGISVEADNDPNFELTYSTFEGNARDTTLYRWVYKQDYITNCNFVGNENSNGLIHLKRYEDAGVRFSSCYFVGNTGDVISEESSDMTIVLDRCTFDCAKTEIPDDVLVLDCAFSVANPKTEGIEFLVTGECVMKITDAGGKGGLSGGAIAGIVIVVLLLIGGGIGCAWYFGLHKKVLSGYRSLFRRDKLLSSEAAMERESFT